MSPKEAVEILGRYFNELDNSFDKLCHLNEGKLFKLPKYVFSKRQIGIFKFKDLDYFLVKAFPIKDSKNDKAYTNTISSNDELFKYTHPMKFDFDFNNPPDDYGMNITNINIREVNNINSLPVVDLALLSIVKADKFREWFSIESAKERALNEWNNIDNNFDNNYSFIHNLKQIFDKFDSIINRNSFVERRVHRFINTHKLYLLPNHVNCYFEHVLTFNGEKRKADFILEREVGLPPILIELESSMHRVFKKNEELTVYANHAGEQIKEWVLFIESNSNNSKGKMQFLRGKKERLIIVGRGLDCMEAMENSKFGENTVWTYDLLSKLAKERWNKLIMDQCKTLNIEKPNLLT